MKLKSYAKINLGLRVLRKREDGYHEIETIYQMVDLYDLLEFQKTKTGVEVLCDHPQVPQGEDNLCFKAADLLRKEAGPNYGARIRISKSIPVGAGLGGGSSNAATTLKGLSLLWGLDLPEEELHQMAKRIGSDVPFFLKGGTALATGRGEILEYVKLPLEFWCVIVYPNIEISTRWVYENFKFDLTNSKKSVKLKRIFDYDFSLDNLRSILINDLERVVFKKYPQLKNIKQEFYLRGAVFSSMSGSGSSIYGIYQNEREARLVFLNFQKQFPTFKVKPILN